MLLQGGIFINVLVTGGAGFIGSHIVDILLSTGYKVSVVDDLSTGRIENINPGAKFYKVCLNTNELENVFSLEQPAVVLHQAAQVNVQRALKEPQADAQINIIGAINLLENCRRFKVTKVIYASSAAVYGNPTYLPVDEKHPADPQSPYGISKHTAEHYLKFYYQAYGIKYTILRYANVYGPRQAAAGEGGVVAIFLNNLLNGSSPKIFGDGEQTRDFIYVKDVANSNLKAVKKGDGAVLNISTGVSLSVKELFYTIKKITGATLEPDYCLLRGGDVTHSCLANNKAIEELGWRQCYSLEKGLRETLEFYVRDRN